jgi:N-dimethylarginine dimethylaminohydrolase
MPKKLTAHSEYGKLNTIFIKHVREGFMNDEKTAAEWKKLNFLSRPNWKAANAQYVQFEDIIKSHSNHLNYLPAQKSLSMDSIYCRDASIATNDGMIICRMGKTARRGEPQAEQKAFKKAGITILGTIQSPGTVEGGDVAWLDEKTLAVGHTYRTNESGISQLKNLLNPINVDLLIADMPHYKGPSDVFHLMSVFSPVDKNLAVVYSPLMPISFRESLLNKKYKLIEVTDKEFESMGCNVLALAPGLCLLVEGNPKIKKALEKAGCRVITYNGDDISVKGGGGPTCLTRPIWREIG